MAVGDLALPLGHVPASAGTAPSLQVCLGRPFRQPVDLPDSTNYSQGLELWVNDADPDRELFAMFDGELSFVPAPAAGQPDTLRLNVSPGTQNQYNNIPGLLEPVPSLLIYENVDQALVKVALSELIQVAYNQATTDGLWSWHPVMRMLWNGTTLKLSLDAAQAQGSGAFAAEVDAVVAAVMNRAGPGPFFPSFSVRAGDCIGAAAAPLTTDRKPSGCTSPARRVTIMVEEYAGHLLNPTYYIWRLLYNASWPQPIIKVQMITRAPIQPDKSFDHPLLQALSLNLNTVVKPRITTSALMLGQAAPETVLLFPTEELSAWHCVQWTNVQSTIVWRITNDANLSFQTCLRGQETVNGCNSDVCSSNPPSVLQGVDVCPSGNGQNQTLTQQVWSAWGDAINETCLELQLPAELVVATIAVESENIPQAVRLEPLKQPTGKQATNPKYNQVLRLQRSGVPQAVINSYIDLTSNPSDPGFSTADHPPAVPLDPYNFPSTTTIYQPLSTLTWGDLLQIVNVVPECASPGLMQTLVKTAVDQYTWLGQWYSDVAKTFGAIDPATFAGGPPSFVDYFRWLLIGTNSILVGAAYLKSGCVKGGVRMDLPRVGGFYNAGSVKDRKEIDDYGVKPHLYGKPNPWRIYYYGVEYPRKLTRCYNAIEGQFNTGTNGAARFWRTLT
ncbi:MAG TPA: hypothetical protein VF043_16760 [Ktedonobacteraceae bacterium]